MSIAREIHRTHQRATPIRAVATHQCAMMRGNRHEDTYQFTFGDGSALTIVRNRVTIEERA
jgi:hypothetical protein